MGRKLGVAVLAAWWMATPETAVAASEADCLRQWKTADGNADGVLIGPEADRYLAYYRVRTKIAPAGGRITRADFMQACMDDVFKARAPANGTPLKGANSFTEAQARDRAIAAGFEEVAPLAKDDDGIWRGTAVRNGRGLKIAVDYKGNVVAE